MDTISVWLIYHTASLGEHSSMNLDGSAYMTGIGVVPAPDIRTALERFDEYLKKQDMAVIDVPKCERYHPENLPLNAIDSHEIVEAVTDAMNAGITSYVCGISSEALQLIADKGHEQH